MSSPKDFVAPAACGAVAAENPNTGNADPAPLKTLTPNTVSALAPATDPAMRRRNVFHAAST
jgi:hypothetical protein